MNICLRIISLKLEKSLFSQNNTKVEELFYFTKIITPYFTPRLFNFSANTISLLITSIFTLGHFTYKAVSKTPKKGVWTFFNIRKGLIILRLPQILGILGQKIPLGTSIIGVDPGLGGYPIKLVKVFKRVFNFQFLIKPKGLTFWVHQFYSSFNPLTFFYHCPFELPKPFITLFRHPVVNQPFKVPSKF